MPPSDDIGKAFEQYYHDLKTSIRRMAPSVDAVAESQQFLTTYVEQIIRSVQVDTEHLKLTTASAIAKQFDSLCATVEAQRQYLADWISAMVRRIDESQQWVEFGRIHQRYVGILAQAGWPPLLHIPIDAVTQLVDEYDEDPDAFVQRISREVVEFHGEEVLREMLARWELQPDAMPHMEILGDCIDAHCSGKYNVSIPTLLTRIEGIIARNQGHTGRFTTDSVRTYVDILIEKDVTYRPTASLILDRIYKRFDWGSEQYPELSRHAIPHGASLRYGTVENSLMLILVVDFILYLIRMPDRRSRAT